MPCSPVPASSHSDAELLSSGAHQGGRDGHQGALEGPPLANCPREEERKGQEEREDPVNEHAGTAVGSHFYPK